MENLINSSYEAALAIDDTIPIPLPDEAMKATIENKKIVDVSKTILAEKTNGDAIGIYKFSGKFSSKSSIIRACLVLKFGIVSSQNSLEKIFIQVVFFSKIDAK